MTASAIGVDLAAMEAIIEGLEKPAENKGSGAANCDYEIADKIGYKLPKDFNFCMPERQLTLLNKGLYLNQAGEVNSLSPYNRKPTQALTVVMPQSVQENIKTEPNTPFVIDLAQARVSSGVSLVPQPQPSTIVPTTIEKQRVSTQKSSSQPVLGCPSFQTFAHRGSFKYPENSIEAVVDALQSGHNGVEIDVQQLRDGKWVVHHDLDVRRVSYGQKGLVTNLTSLQWYKVRLKDPSGTKTEINAPFFDNLLDVYRDVASASQVLNIEVKGGLKTYNCDALASLNRLVLNKLPQKQFLYSSRSVEHLSCLRMANPNVYLGLVIDPHIDSIDFNGNSSTGRAASFYDEIKGVGASKSSYLNNSNRDFLKKTSFKDFQRLIGPYYGLHIDYHDYLGFSANPSPGKGRLMLYQLDDDKGLIALLNKIKEHQKKLPDAVIVDTERDAYCDVRS